MRFSYAESMVDPSFYLPLARAAEEAGYDSHGRPRQPLLSGGVGLDLPLQPDHTREFLEDKPFIEPFSLIPAMGAVTERLRFVTFVLKLPMRHPLLVAKQATSVAVMTDNRLALGVGSQPLARGLRAGRTCPGRAGAGGWTRPSPSCGACRPAGTSSTTASVYDLPLGQDQSHSRPSPCPSWWEGTPRRPCAGPPGRTAGSTAVVTPTTSRACWPSCDSSREEEGTADRALRGPRDLPRRLHASTASTASRSRG